MRRSLFSLLAIGFLAAVMGCRATHGVCDCCNDMDDFCGGGGCGGGGCSSCAASAQAAPRPAESIPAPIPKVEETQPNAGKKL